MSRKIYVIGRAVGYANWMQGELVKTMEEANLVVLTGGEDINPHLYGEPKHPTTYFSDRDHKEVSEYFKAKSLKIPVIGICRGLQLITALNGGILIQDQNNPGTHLMKVYNGPDVVTTSAHHQAAYPFLLPKTDYKILGWTKNMLRYHKKGDNTEMNPPVEVEIIYFPKTKSLGIQGHPEWLPENHESIVFFRTLLNSFLSGNLENETRNLELHFQEENNLVKLK